MTATALNNTPADPQGRYPLLTVAVNQRTYGIRAEDIAEIVPFASLSCEGQQPSVLAGFLNLAGTPVPVVDLASLLALPTEPAGLNASIVILRSEQARYGLLVSQVCQIVIASKGDILLLPAPTAVASAVRLGDHIIPIISVGTLLLAQERARIKELQESVERRLGKLAGAAS